MIEVGNMGRWSHVKSWAFEHRWDIVLASVLGVLAFAEVMFISGRLYPYLTPHEEDPPEIKAATFYNLWFDADCPRYIQTMAHKSGFIERAEAHPLFATISYPPTRIFRFLGFPKPTAIRLTLAVIGATFAALGFLMLRLQNLWPINAFLLILICLTAAAFVCFFTIPESFSLAATSIIVGLLVLRTDGVDARGDVTNNLIRHTVAGAIFLSITVTNWATSFFAAFLKLTKREAFLSLAASLGIVSALVALESIISPYISGPFIGFVRDKRFVVDLLEEDSRWTRPFILLAYTIIFPSNVHKKPFPVSGEFVAGTSYQEVRLVENYALTFLTGAIWLAILAIGVVATVMRTLRNYKSIDGLVLMSFLAQFALFLVYGRETFLYVALMLPWLLLIVGNAVDFLGQRRMSLALGILVVLNGVNSIMCFPKAESALQEVYYQRRERLAQRAVERPGHDGKLRESK